MGTAYYKTLRDALDNNESVNVEEIDNEYLCDCGQIRKAELLVDVRALPIDEEFVCDGCMSTWQRTGLPIDGGGPVANEKQWKRRLAVAFGAPQEILDKIDAQREPDNYGRVMLGNNEVGPEAIRDARRANGEQRRNAARMQREIRRRGWRQPTPPNNPTNGS